ncbi:hypothetical protein QFC19_000697 [Naganishia cerealis]|uniref:Uncharacterized protein n=1 Tax=Naganishia cerealis TaxID=610337 RepID=A0ACC2WLI9_9TREE|nr:hypothetical protein QFC19_000697 [Naganishia cerealis]
MSATHANTEMEKSGHTDSASHAVSSLDTQVYELLKELENKLWELSKAKNLFRLESNMYEGEFRSDLNQGRPVTSRFGGLRVGSLVYHRGSSFHRDNAFTPMAGEQAGEVFNYLLVKRQTGPPSQSSTRPTIEETLAKIYDTPGGIGFSDGEIKDDRLTSEAWEMLKHVRELAAKALECLNATPPGAEKADGASSCRDSVTQSRQSLENNGTLHETTFSAMTTDTRVSPDDVSYASDSVLLPQAGPGDSQSTKLSSCPAAGTTVSTKRPSEA